MLAPVVIFALTYVAIAARRLPFVPLDRPAVALVGAVAMVAVGGLGLDEALAAIDLHVIVLLFGVMVIAAYLERAHAFRFTAWWVLTRARSARALLWALVFVAGGLSALLVNDTVCLVLTPLVVAVVIEAELPPLPFLLALASATNVGGVVSFTGNPQNMIIGRAAAGEPSFAEYSALVLPIGVACLAVDALVLCWLFRSQLPVGTLPERTTPRPYLDVRLTATAVAALLGFVAMAVAGVPLEAASATAAAALIVTARLPPREILRRADWPLLLFFAGLFVVVRGVSGTGVLDDAWTALAPAGDAAPSYALLQVGALSVLGSNLVSNVPFVIIAVDWIPSLAEPRWGYVVLAVTSTLAGNLTLFGSVANIIVFESAGARGRIGFWQFMRYGAVVSLATLVVALAIVLLERALGL